MSDRRIFEFKQFSVQHEMCALPVGFDGVLLGAWVNLNAARSILDVGTGCGVIALICAQRCDTANIIGIDIDNASVQEAGLNFKSSTWSRRLTSKQMNFNTLASIDDKVWGSGFDLIISNPPFFDAGVKEVTTDRRMSARHVEDFGPISLIEQGTKLLSDIGSIALICPATMEHELITTTHRAGLFVRRLCRVYGKHPKGQHARKDILQSRVPKRILFQASRLFGDCIHDELIVYNLDGSYTNKYRSLTKDLYINI
ncbi:MAG: methyltransferase [Muribaculaceae bacterium]|nr:methyltransferase [Muribaculaceae bacterium]